jgi:hypothetical protein
MHLPDPTFQNGPAFSYSAPITTAIGSMGGSALEITVFLSMVLSGLAFSVFILVFGS